MGVFGEEILCTSSPILEEGLILMQDGKDTQVKNALRSDIEVLQNRYAALRSYLAGAETDTLEVSAALQVFKDTLDRISTHILTLYVLKGQKTKITWEPLLTNVNNALITLRSSANPNPKAAIQLALNMSEPNAEEVMVYLAKLKEALQ